jgi:hypothetical protein
MNGEIRIRCLETDGGANPNSEDGNNGRVGRFASIALSCLTTSHLGDNSCWTPSSIVPAQVCKVRLADHSGMIIFLWTLGSLSARIPKHSELPYCLALIVGL